MLGFIVVSGVVTIIIKRICNTIALIISKKEVILPTILNLVIYKESYLMLFLV